MVILMDERFEVDVNLVEFENKVETFEVHSIHDEYDDTFYFIIDSIENVEHLCDKLNTKEKAVQSIQNENKILWDENHRLRLTLLHQEDLRNDIKWLKENIEVNDGGYKI